MFATTPAEPTTMIAATLQPIERLRERVRLIDGETFLSPCECGTFALVRFTINVCPHAETKSPTMWSGGETPRHSLRRIVVLDPAASGLTVQIDDVGPHRWTTPAPTYCSGSSPPPTIGDPSGHLARR
jgi:hypothetical protein